MIEDFKCLRLNYCMTDLEGSKSERAKLLLPFQLELELPHKLAAEGWTLDWADWVEFFYLYLPFFKFVSSMNFSAGTWRTGQAHPWQWRWGGSLSAPPEVKYSFRLSTTSWFRIHSCSLGPDLPSPDVAPGGPLAEESVPEEHGVAGRRQPPRHAVWATTCGVYNM